MRRIPLSIEARKVLKMLVGTLLCMLVLTSAYFFVKMSTTAEKGYSFQENQLRRNELEAENRILKQRLLEAQSITELELSDIVSKMREPEKPTILEPLRPISKKR